MSAHFGLIAAREHDLQLSPCNLVDVTVRWIDVIQHVPHPESAQSGLQDLRIAGQGKSRPTRRHAREGLRTRLCQIRELGPAERRVRTAERGRASSVNIAGALTHGHRDELSGAEN